MSNITRNKSRFILNMYTLGSDLNGREWQKKIYNGYRIIETNHITTYTEISVNQ